MATLAADPEVEASVRQVLAAPPFSTPSLDSQLLERLAEWYRNHVRDLYLHEPIVFWLSIIGLTLVAALLIWHLAHSTRAVWRALKRRPGVAAEIVSPRAGLRLDGARAALAAGEYRACVERSWQAVVDTFVEATESTETPRGQARLLATRLGRERAASVYQLLAVHEQACYAGVPATAAMAGEALTVALALDPGVSHG